MTCPSHPPCTWRRLQAIASLNNRRKKNTGQKIVSRRWHQGSNPRFLHVTFILDQVAMEKGFSRYLVCVVQRGTMAHQASYPVGTGNSFLEVTAAEAWGWPFASNWCQGKNTLVYISTPHTSSSCSAEAVKHRDSFALTLLIIRSLLHAYLSPPPNDCPKQTAHFFIPII
jgi:hypothetical protein